MPWAPKERLTISTQMKVPLSSSASTPPEVPDLKRRRPMCSTRDLRWWSDWLPLLVLPLAVVALAPAHWPRWAFMWVLAMAIMFGCKWLTWWRRPYYAAPIWRHVSYFIAWPGMDAEAFFNLLLHPAKPKAREWLSAFGKLALGIVLFYGLAKRIPPTHPYWVGWIGMIGLVMILHFGIFHLLSCGLRTAGVEARPLMNSPMASVGLDDFWGRRWNTAFRDLTHRFLFLPLTRRLGARGALIAGFVVSGLIHDAVISFPAGGGYGGPTLFFLFQAVGLFAERSRVGRRLGLRSGMRGWLFTMACLTLPAPLLFHKPFVIRIIVPFMHATGAI